jgi:hypothetical protein
MVLATNKLIFMVELPMENHINTPQSIQNAIEQVSDSVTFEWLFNKQGFAITVANGSRETTDAWFDKVREVALNWPANKVLVSLYHYNFELLSMSPYARSRAEGLRDLRPELKACSAVVLKGQVIAQIAQLFMRLKPQKNLSVRFFFKRDDAEAWLKQELESFTAIASS